MYEEMKKIEDINTRTMYRMIQALFRYDYFTTKCFVNELLKKRKDEKEIENLRVIQDLLFHQDSTRINQLLTELIDGGKDKRNVKEIFRNEGINIGDS